MAMNLNYSKYFEGCSRKSSGTHLTPLLYNIFVNDINTCFRHSKFYLFVYDINFVHTISTPNDTLGTTSRQFKSLTVLALDVIIIKQVSIQASAISPFQ